LISALALALFRLSQRWKTDDQSIVFSTGRRRLTRFVVRRRLIQAALGFLPVRRWCSRVHAHPKKLKVGVVTVSQPILLGLAAHTEIFSFFSFTLFIYPSNGALLASIELTPNAIVLELENV
ncbi:hypothetical protein BU15DRAFT_69651, partial [Melanogaster broomeanus]